MCNAENTGKMEAACLRAAEEQSKQQSKSVHATQENKEPRATRRVNWETSTRGSTSSDEPPAKENGTASDMSTATGLSDVFRPTGSPSTFSDDTEDMHRGMEEEFKSVLKRKGSFAYKGKKLQTSEPWKLKCTNKFGALDGDTMDGTEESEEPTRQPEVIPKATPQAKRQRGTSTRAGRRMQEKRATQEKRMSEIDDLTRQINDVSITQRQMRVSSTRTPSPPGGEQTIEARPRTPSPPPEERTEEYYEKLSQDLLAFFGKTTRIPDWVEASRKPAQETNNGDSQRASTPSNDRSQTEEQSSEASRTTSSTDSTNQEDEPTESACLNTEGMTDVEIQEMIAKMPAEEAEARLNEIIRLNPVVHVTPLKGEVETWDMSRMRPDNSRFHGTTNSDQIQARRWERTQAPRVPMQQKPQRRVPDYALTTRGNTLPTQLPSQPGTEKNPPRRGRSSHRSTGWTPKKQVAKPSESSSKSPAPASMSGGGGGGGKRNIDEQLKESEDRLFLRRLTKHTVFWNGNKDYRETFELNIYFSRRNTAFEHPAIPCRIPPEYMERAKDAYNRVYGEGFWVMRAGTNGHPIPDKDAYTQRRFDADKKILEAPATRFDKSRQRLLTNMETEEEARYPESNVDEMRCRQAITQDLKDVYEAFDRRMAMDTIGGWGEDKSTESTRLTTTEKDTEVMRHVDLLGQLSGIELQELRTRENELISTEIKNATLGQVYYAITEGMVSGDLWEQVEGGADLTAVGTAYEQTFAHSPDEEIRKLLFDQRLQSTDSTLEEHDYRKQLSQELALLAMPTGKTVRVEGIDEEVTETFGMSYAAYEARDTDELTVTRKYWTDVHKAYDKLRAAVPYSALWDYLFLGTRLPNRTEIRARDGKWMMKPTGHQTQWKGQVMEETYGIVEHQSRELKTPRSNIPHEHKTQVKEAYTRYTRGYSKAQVEKLIYGRVPPDSMEIDTQGGTEERAKSTHVDTDEPMDDGTEEAAHEAEAQRIQSLQYQQDADAQEEPMEAGGDEPPPTGNGGDAGSRKSDKKGDKKKDRKGEKPKGKKRWSSSSSDESSSDESSETDGSNGDEEKMDTGEKDDEPQEEARPKRLGPVEANKELWKKLSAIAEDHGKRAERHRRGVYSEEEQEPEPPKGRQVVKMPIGPQARPPVQGEPRFTPITGTETGGQRGTGRATLFGLGASRGYGFRQEGQARGLPTARAPTGSSRRGQQQMRARAVGGRYFQPICDRCGLSHELGACPRQSQQRRRPQAARPFSQTTTGRQPSYQPPPGSRPMFGGSMTGEAAAEGSYTLAGSKRFATSSVGGTSSQAAPPVPPASKGYQAPAKRAQSIRGKKKAQEYPALTAEKESSNGMAKRSFMAGGRAVLTELTRHYMDDMKSLGTNTLIYTVVYGGCGHGIGWLDKANNRDIIARFPDMDFPLLMQFGERSMPNEVYYFTGERRKVMSYGTLRNERGLPEPKQSMNAPLTDFIDPVTHRLKPSTVCVFSALDRESPSRIQKRIGIVHDHRSKTNAQGLIEWEMEVCTTDARGALPIEVANEHISYGINEPFNRGDWCAVDGFKVNKNFPNYMLGGCIFPLAVPGSTRAEEGFYPVRVSYTDRRQVLEETRFDWREENEDRFRMIHGAMTEACGATLQWESVLRREKADGSTMPIVKTRKLEKGLYEFTVNPEGLTGDHLSAACSLRNMIKITEVSKTGERNIVMYGIVTATRFANEVIHTVTVRHVFTSKEVPENERELAGRQKSALDDPESLTKIQAQLMRLAMGNETRDDFYKKRIENKTLTITQTQPTMVTDAFLAMVPRLGSKTCPVGPLTRLGMINAVMNGYVIQQGPMVTLVMIERELAQLKRVTRPSERTNELLFMRKWIGLIEDTNLDEEQKMVVKLAAVDYCPVINTVAPGGTGKTHVGINIIACMLDRNRSLRKGRPWRIVVCTPNNAVAAEFGERLLDLRVANVLGPYEAIVIQSATQLMMRNEEVPFSLVEKAKYILERHQGTVKVQEILKTFVGVVEGNPQVHFNMSGVLQACTHYEEPCIIVSTDDMLARYPTLTKNCTQFIFEETSRETDLKARTLICRLEGLEQVVLLGDPAQLAPYVDIREIAQRAKFGMSSLAEQVTNRGLAHTCTLVNNRRSVVQLVQCLRQMSEHYKDMVSLVETPDYKEDPMYSMPPLPQADCPIVLLHTTGVHKKTRAATISNILQDRGAIALVRLMEGFHAAEGVTQQDCLLTTTYAGQRDYIESKLSKVVFSRGTGVETVDGSQGKEAGASIYVTGRGGPPATSNADDFAKDPRRGVVALGRARHRVYIIGNFDYLTQDENSPIAKYILEATTYTPVVDLGWYIDSANDYLSKVEALGEDEVYPEIYTFGPEVLQFDYCGGTTPTKQDHIVDCNVNRSKGWKDRRLFEEKVEEGYMPPTPGPFNVIMTEPSDPGVSDIAKGIGKLGE